MRYGITARVMDGQARESLNNAYERSRNMYKLSESRLDVIKLAINQSAGRCQT